jgi:intracellular septation protein A
LSILVGFAPFIAFFVMTRIGSAASGLWLAAILALAVALHDRWRGVSVKIIEIGAVLLFGGLALLTALAGIEWSVAAARAAVDGGLALIVAVSLLIGRPFTLQYARERVPEALWTSPIFLSVNRRITLVWGAAFVVMTLADLAAIYVPAIPIWVDVVATLVALVAAIRFTSWYPEQVRRQVAGAA